MTVGVVLVSHSAALARGAAELAREMAGDVPLEPAGGLDEPDEPLGTDATRVAAAIGRADDGDGVLVLMDLGSAVLSAETALDLLEDVDRDRVWLSAAPLVEGAVAAAVAAQAGSSLDEVAREAGGGLAGKADHLGDEGSGETAGSTPAFAGGVSAQVDVRNRLGLHARPAARLVRAFSELDADVRIANLTTGRGPVSARSLSGLATLGAVGGHRLEATASGSDADAALDVLRRQAADGFGDRDEEAPSAAEPAEASAAGMNGLPGAPGSGYGPVRRLHAPEPPEQDPPAGTPEQEGDRLRGAVESARAELERARDDASRTTGSDTAGIFDAQALLLADAAVLDAAESAARDGAVAERAWRQAVTPVADAYRQIDDPYQRARADDVDDVARRVLAHLAGLPVTPVLSGPGVLVAETLGPADTATLDPGTVQAILTARGAPTGHAAILARARGIPAVVGAGDAVLALDEGRQVLVDGDTGAVHVDPEDALVREYGGRRAEREEADRTARTKAHEPAVTTDGARILVAANVGSVEDASAAASAGADGIGLLRTEFLFLGRAEPPTEDEQARTYAEIAGRIGGAGRVRVRTFDIGADKPAAYLPQAPEDNPFLGVRGLRLGIAHPDLLRTQLNAILGTDAPVDAMLPMVSTVEEVDRVRELVDLGDVRLGAMVEVPSAALLADALASRVDFLSIGTNDLVQYVLAAERGNASVAHLADPCHPAVLGLIGGVAAAAGRAGIEAAVCGEMASDPALVPLLVGLGIGELSVSPAMVPAVKQAVRETSRAAAEQLAAEALASTSAAEVRDRVASVG